MVLCVLNDSTDDPHPCLRDYPRCDLRPMGTCSFEFGKLLSCHWQCFLAKALQCYQVAVKLAVRQILDALFGQEISEYGNVAIEFVCNAGSQTLCDDQRFLQFACLDCSVYLYLHFQLSLIRLRMAGFDDVL